MCERKSNVLRDARIELRLRGMQSIGGAKQCQAQNCLPWLLSLVNQAMECDQGSIDCKSVTGWYFSCDTVMHWQNESTAKFHSKSTM